MKQINFLEAVIFRDDAPIPNVYAVILNNSAVRSYVISVAERCDSISQFTSILDKSDISYNCIRIDEITHIHQN